MSKSRDYADLKQDLDDSAFSRSYNDLDDRPTIPTNVSQLTNDANYTANAVTSVNGETGSSVSLSLNDLDDVDTSAAGTQKFLTKTGSTHLYSSVDYNNVLNTPDLSSINIGNGAISNQLTIDTDKLEHTTQYGYLRFGPTSMFMANFETDRFYFNFNKNVTITGGAFCTVGNTSTVHLSNNSDDSFATQYKVVHDNSDVRITNENGTLYVAGVDVATRNAALTQAESDIDALEAKTSLTDFTNDISEVTTTTPTSGTGKPVGYVWYVI